MVDEFFQLPSDVFVEIGNCCRTWFTLFLMIKSVKGFRRGIREDRIMIQDGVLAMEVSMYVILFVNMIFKSNLSKT